MSVLVDVFARLDRLASLARSGVDVAGVLHNVEQEEVCLKGEETNGVSLRLPAAFIAEADELVSTLQATAEARAAGGHWGRSGVLRLAVGEGLRVLGSKGISSTDPTGDEVLTAVCMWLRNRANYLDNNGSYTLPNGDRIKSDGREGGLLDTLADELAGSAAELRRLVALHRRMGARNGT